MEGTSVVGSPETPAEPDGWSVAHAAVRASPQERATRQADAPFGTVFTEHMVTIRWSGSRGWHEPTVAPYGPITIDPATSALHYGQVVFEGLKAYRLHDGGVAVFRPVAHARRLRASARRLMMPELPVDLFVAAIEQLVDADRDWIPADPSMSLYLRPVLYASEKHLGLRPANEYVFLLLAFVTEGFFGRTVKPVTVWACFDYSRAAPGGTGAAKCVGNYAGAYLAQAQAVEHGCDQVVWLDAVERRWVEELGGMNLFFVRGNGSRPLLCTPPLSGTILPGVTRDSLLRLATDLDMTAVERPVSLDEWRAGCAAGDITEVFACGTAARVSPVGEVRSADGSWSVGDGMMGPVTKRVADRLFAIQRGEVHDTHGWLHVVGNRGPGVFR